MKDRRESQKKYREEHKEKIKLLQQKWYLKNKKHSIKKNKKWVKLNPDRKRNNDLKSLFGITLDQYNQMLKEQNGVCAICGKEESEIDKRINRKRNLSVDHNHKTNKVRGLLCGKCNKMLGLSSDNKQILINAIEYLTKE
jgi:23S rRNA G2069 N7-methylase RlmK/C1962 C5-methylase RlmI